MNFLKRIIARIKETDLRGLLVQLRSIAAPMAFGTLVYGFALIFFFPYQRVGEYAEAVVASMGMDLTVQDVTPTFGVGVNLNNLKLSTRPRDGSKPLQLTVARARVTTNPIINLTGGIDYSASLDLLGGEVDLSVRADEAGGQGEVEARGLVLTKIPDLHKTLGLPVKGSIDLKVAMELPKFRTGEAEGELSFTCTGCEVGDDKAKLTVAGNPMLAEGLIVPRLKIGNLAGHIAFENGIGKLSGVRAKSPDGEILIDGEVRLADPVGASYVDLYLRFKAADRLIKSSDKIQLLLQLAEGQGKRPDGFYGLRVRGSLRNLESPRWQKEAPSPSGGAGSARGAPFGKPRSGSKRTRVPRSRASTGEPSAPI